MSTYNLKIFQNRSSSKNSWIKNNINYFGKFNHMKKFIKYTLIVLAIIVLGLLAIGFIAPKKYDMTRSIWIKANRKTVWNQAALFNNFDNWSPWRELDTAMTHTLEGTDGTVGAKWIWKSKTAGNGSMTNTEVTGMDSRTYDLRFEDWGGVSSCKMTFKDSADGTIISWGMKGENNFMGAIFMFFMGGMEGAVGKDYDKGLEKLKKYCEAHPEAAGEPWKMNPVEMKDFPKTTFVQIKRDAKISDYIKNAGTWTQEMAGKLMGYVMGNKLNMTGTMFSIYYTWDEKADKTTFSVAVPVDKESAAKGDGISYETIPAAKCAIIDFWGDYQYTGKAHMAMSDWMKAEKKEPAGATMEEYVTDPGKEKDPAKWQTRIWYPVK